MPDRSHVAGVATRRALVHRDNRCGYVERLRRRPVGRSSTHRSAPPRSRPRSGQPSRPRSRRLSPVRQRASASSPGRSLVDTPKCASSLPPVLRAAISSRSRSRHSPHPGRHLSLGSRRARGARPRASVIRPARCCWRVERSPRLRAVRGVRWPFHGVWCPTALAEAGSDICRVCLTRLRGVFRLSQPLDASFRLQPLRPCFMPVTPLGFRFQRVSLPGSGRRLSTSPSLRAVYE